METETGMYLKIEDAANLAGVGRSTIYDWMERYKFPRPLKLGGRVVRWKASEVIAWLDKQPRSK